MELFTNEKFWQAVVAGGIAAFASMGGKLYAESETQKVGVECQAIVIDVIKHFGDKNAR